MARSGDPDEARITIDGGDGAYLHALHEFFVTEAKPPQEACGRLYPVVAMALLENGDPYQEYPVFLPEGESSREPAALGALLRDSLKAEGCGEVTERLLPYLLTIVSAAAGMGVKFPEALLEALDRLKQAADLSPAARSAFEREIEVLKKALSFPGSVVALRQDAWFSFLRWASVREKRTIRRKLLGDIRSLVDQIEAILLVDRSLRPSARSETFFRSTLGSSGGSFFDLKKLSGTVPAPKGPVGLSAERRQHLELLLDQLRDFTAKMGKLPEGCLVHSADSLPFDPGPGWTQTSAVNPFAEALKQADELSREALEFLKAVRAARYEIEGTYDPVVHGASINRLTWDMCSSDELAFIPQLVVWESVDRLFAENLQDFHRVLEDGKPIHVVLTTDGPLPDPGCDRLSGVIADPGFLGISYREVFVLQSSVGSPWHLLQGLRRMTRVPGPAVCVVAFPRSESVEDNWRLWLSAWLSRSLPSYLYDPWQGESWAERFSLAGNFEPQETGIRAGVDRLDYEGQPIRLEERLTLAHAAALDPRFREHFWVLPEPVPGNVELVTVDEYLDRQPTLDGFVIPFIWVSGPEGRTLRAAVSSRLLNACRDRQRAWRMLQELAGIRNVHVEKAVAETLSVSEREAAARLEAERTAAREEGAREAVDRLVSILADPDALLQSFELPLGSPMPGGPALAPVAPSVTEAAAAESAAVPAPAASPTPAAVAEEEEEAGEAYIDSFLCTSCNDCINSNSRMFKYNQDRQAYLADPSAGTFLELVKAAEACPARCIHPGAPRPGDTTVTEDLLRRAKAFR